MLCCPGLRLDREIRYLEPMCIRRGVRFVKGALESALGHSLKYSNNRRDIFWGCSLEQGQAEPATVGTEGEIDLKSERKKESSHLLLQGGCFICHQVDRWACHAK